MNFFSRIADIWRKSKKEERRYKPKTELDEQGRERLILKLDSPESAYSPFSVKEQRRISPEAWAYLTGENRHIAPLVIEVRNAEIADSPELQKEFKETLHEEGRFENFTQFRRRRMNAIKAWMLLFIGFFVIALSIFLNSTVSGWISFVVQTIDILAWVVIWEAFDAFIFVRAELKRKYMMTYRIRAADIVFTK